MGVAPAGQPTLAAIDDELRRETSSPEIKVGVSVAGRSTLAGIEAELRREVSSPEIRVAEGIAGRETMAAIAEELSEDAPEIEVSHQVAGRETLAAIAHEIEIGEPESGSRTRMTTLDYGDGDRSRKATPPRVAAEAVARVPTLRPRATAVPAPAGLDIHELFTFVVRGADSADLAAQEARQKFVSERLVHCLPRGMDTVDRIDVQPWTERGMIVVRVWCKV